LAPLTQMWNDIRRSPENTTNKSEVHPVSSIANRI